MSKENLHLIVDKLTKELASKMTFVEVYWNDLSKKEEVDNICEKLRDFDICLLVNALNAHKFEESDLPFLCWGARRIVRGLGLDSSYLEGFENEKKFFDRFNQGRELIARIRNQYSIEGPSDILEAHVNCVIFHVLGFE